MLLRIHGLYRRIGWLQEFLLLCASLAVVLLLVRAMEAPGQGSPLKGVVWTPPSDISEILADLSTMRALRVEAVRTGLIEDVRILMIADSLGLMLFQDLPTVWLPASALLDTLPHAQRLLQAAMERSRPYRSARHFGLASASDTSDPAACAYFHILAAQVERLPDAQSYYRSLFIEEDQCAGAVDFVLLETLGEEHPMGKLRRWSHPVPVGLGSVGRLAVPEAAGLLHPNSAASQARYLETHLNVLLDGEETIAVFVYRWRDAPQNTRLGGTYGLISSKGVKRAAFDVVQGIYSGTQRAFAFSLGVPPQRSFPWHMAAGWLAFGLFGLMYYASPRFSFTLRRYFTSHSFYMQSILSGRELSYMSAVIHVIVHALCTGVIAETIIAPIQDRLPFGSTHGPVPGAWVLAVAVLPVKPGVLLGGFALAHVATVVIVPLLIRLMHLRLRSFGLAKAYLVVTWPFWHVLPLALVSMAVPSLSGGVALGTALVLCALWIVMTVRVAARIIVDLVAINPRQSTRVIAYACSVVALLVTITIGAVLQFAPDMPEQLAFLWHCATRT